MKNIRPQVLWFAEEMEETLKDNDHKGGWEDCTFMYLLSSLQKEVAELFNEFTSPREYNDLIPKDETYVIKECTDIANFAMMIADNAKKFSE